MSNATRCAEHVKSTCSDSLRFVRKEKKAITRCASPRISSASECFCIGSFGIGSVGSFGDRQHRKLFGIGSFEQLVTAPCPPLAGR